MLMMFWLFFFNALINQLLPPPHTLAPHLLEETKQLDFLHYNPTIQTRGYLSINVILRAGLLQRF